MGDFDDKTHVLGEPQRPGLGRLGKYELLVSIGAGGMAKVYLARQHGPVSFAKLVVIKTIHAHLERNEQFVKMFLDEARIAAQISHPNVIQVFDLGIENDTYFIVMEYLPGQALSTVINAAEATRRPLAPQICARIMARVAEGLHAAHELKSMTGEALDVVHRDVTPANIIVTYDGRVKVVDFGVAKARGRLSGTRGGQLKGKLSYMSPEQVRNRPIDRRADVYSAGVVLWETLALRRLFGRASIVATIDDIVSKSPKPPSHFRRDTPTALDNVVLRALEKSPAARYQSAKELQIELDQISAGSVSDVDISNWMTATFKKHIEARTRMIEQVVSSSMDLDPDDMDSLSTMLSVELTGPLSLSEPNSDSIADDNPWDSPVGTDEPLRLDSSDDAPLFVNDADDTLVAAEIGDEFAEKSGEFDDIATFPDLEFSSTDDTFGDEIAGLHDESTPGRWPRQRTLGVAGIACLLVVGLAVGLWAVWPKPEPATPAPTIGAGKQVVVDDDDDPVGTGTDDSAQQEEPNDTSAEAAVQPAGAPDVRSRRLAPRRVSKPAKSSTPKLKRGDAAAAKSRFEEGMRLFVSGKPAEAEREFRSAVAADPTFAPAHRGLGLLYQRSSKKILAIKHLRTYLKLAPLAPDAAALRKHLESLTK